ncbi:MAG: hypothetical protein VYE22_24585 [Myxococcota bacterium]|nr:hypothetical protein [Myxococcota bacterium]
MKSWIVIGCVAVGLLAWTGCRRRGGGGSGGGSAGGEYTGTLTFENASGQPLCGVELVQDDHTASYGERIEPGESVQLEVQSEVDDLFVTSCDGDGFLYADSLSVDGDHYTFDSPAPQGFGERLDYLRRLNRMNTNPIMQDPALEAEMHSAVQMRARDQGWIDDPAVTRIASDEWSTLRHNRSGLITGRRIAGVVGHRFPDGHCSIQIHVFRQEHDGSDFSGPVRYEGTAGNIFAGCAMIAWLAGESGGVATQGASAGGAASSGGGGGEAQPSGGGSCTNTCSSANDGECDDGGPDSLYSVCALGTDCADCGPR